MLFSHQSLLLNNKSLFSYFLNYFFCQFLLCLVLVVEINSNDLNPLSTTNTISYPSSIVPLIQLINTSSFSIRYSVIFIRILQIEIKESTLWIIKPLGNITHMWLFDWMLIHYDWNEKMYNLKNDDGKDKLHPK